MHLQDLNANAVRIYNSKTATHLVGPPGVGKSDAVEIDMIRILSEHFNEEFGFCALVLPEYDAPDLRGFLIPTKDKEGNPTSFFTRPSVIPSVEYLRKHPRGLMFLDERNQADQLLQKAVAASIYKMRFGDFHLPEGWRVISASNRQQDGSGVGKALKHLVNRERTIHIEPHVTSWAVWAEARSIHPMLIAFAKARSNIVFRDTVPKEDGPFCTPRSYVSAATLIGEIAGVDANGNPNMKIPNDGIMMQLVGGDIGDAAAAELFAYLKIADDLPTIDEILASPSTCKCPKELSAAYAGVQMTIHYAKPDNIDKLWTFAERMPKELQVSACKSLVAKGAGALLNSPALAKWIMSNKALINATSAK